MQFGIYDDELDPDTTFQSDAGTEDASVIIENEDHIDENEVFEETEDTTEDNENEVEIENVIENKSVNGEDPSPEDKILNSIDVYRDTKSSLSDEHIQWNDLIDMEEKTVQVQCCYIFIFCLDYFFKYSKFIVLKNIIKFKLKKQLQ